MVLVPSPRARVVAAAAVLLPLLAACASVPAADPTETTAPLPPASALPTEAVDGTDGPGVPGQRLEAGSVADGAPVTLTGDGPALIAFTRTGDAGVVAHLDCSACTGPVVVTAENRDTPWGRGEAPLSGSYLVDALEDPDPARGLVIEAEGAWSVRLESWNDLPEMRGPQHGTGAAVLRIGDAAPSIEIGFTPAGPGDELLARGVSDADVTAPLVFGADTAVVQSYELAMPGIVALSTAGSWTVSPEH